MRSRIAKQNSGTGALIDSAVSVGQYGAMPRKARKAPGGIVFHCINRGVGRNRLFHKPQDYAAFERVMAYALEAVPVRLLAYCLMPNHYGMQCVASRAGRTGGAVAVGKPLAADEPRRAAIGRR